MWYVPANLSCPGTQSQLTFPRPLPYLIRARTHDDVRRGLKQWNPFAPFRNASLAASTCGTTLTPLPRASETRFVGAPGPSLPGRVTATLYTSSGPPTRGGCSALAMGASVRASFFFFFFLWGLSGVVGPRFDGDGLRWIRFAGERVLDRVEVLVSTLGLMGDVVRAHAEVASQHAHGADLPRHAGPLHRGLKSRPPPSTAQRSQSQRPAQPRPSSPPHRQRSPRQPVAQASALASHVRSGHVKPHNSPQEWTRGGP